MRLPARAITGHLVWGRDGSTWAVYAVDVVSYPYLPLQERLRLHGRLRAAFMALPPESMLLSVCRRVDPGEVVGRMIDGVDLAGCPVWADHAEATLDSLAEASLFERRHYVALQLRTAGVQSASGLLASAAAPVAERFGLPPTPIRHRDVEARRRQVAELEAQLRGSLPLRRVGAGELRWVYARAFHRGVGEPFLDPSWDTSVSPEDAAPDRPVASPALQHLADAVVYEGGARDDVDRPRHRRYLRIDTAAGTGYQTFMVVADMPRLFTFPGGGEWFFHLDNDAIAFPVDWCVRLAAIPNEEAKSKARHQARQLAGQFEQYGDDDDIAAGGTDRSVHGLVEAVEGIREEHRELDANRAQPELQATVVLGLAADTLDELEDRATTLESLFHPAGYGLARPTGGQGALFTAMLPGSPTPSAARDYTQYLLPGDLAGGAPFTGRGVGDPTGELLGTLVEGSGFAPVLFAPERGPRIDTSGSLAAVGGLGAGKSYAVKRMTWAALARGGRVVALDRTERGEYVRFADVAPCTSQVVRLGADSPVCLDPLRVFRGEDRVAVTVGFLTVLTRTSPSGLDGAALAEAVRTVAERPDGTLADVVTTLEAAAADDDAAVVAKKLRNYARNRLAGLAFDTTRELLTLDADYIVFHTPGLQLPKREELIHEHLERQLLPEQILSQALLYLVAAVSRKVTFADPSRFGVFLCDEAYSLLGSMQGGHLAFEYIRDSRKHNAAVWLLTQDPRDISDDIVELLGSRFAFRVTPGAAPATGRFLGVDPDGIPASLTDHSDAGGRRPRLCMYRDLKGRVDLVQVLQAPEPLDTAFQTGVETAVAPLAGAEPTDPATGTAPAAMVDPPAPQGGPHAPIERSDPEAADPLFDESAARAGPEPPAAFS